MNQAYYDTIKQILDHPENTKHVLPEDLMYKSLTNVTTFRFCKLSGVDYSSIDYTRMDFIPDLTIIRELSSINYFMTMLYALSYVHGLVPPDTEETSDHIEARDIFEWIESDALLLGCVNISDDISVNRFIYEHKPGIMDTDEYGKTLAVLWIETWGEPPVNIRHDPTFRVFSSGDTMALTWVRLMRTVPPEWMLAGGAMTVVDNTGDTLAMTWVRYVLTDVPERLMHGPLVRNKYGDTLGMMYVEHLKKEPPVALRHKVSLRGYDGHNIAMLMIINRVELPDWVLKDPSFDVSAINVQGHTCMILWIMTRKTVPPPFLFHDPNTIRGNTVLTVWKQYLREEPPECIYTKKELEQKRKGRVPKPTGPSLASIWARCPIIGPPPTYFMSM